ncbi:hypothetical protein [Chitinibacter sp. S2-10]|uniref:hypothetical protein n=1 Tax=Chitinibacter sp. S2-10 TaxID=3373597 RepID=UPI003977680E
MLINWVSRFAALADLHEFSCDEDCGYFSIKFNACAETVIALNELILLGSGEFFKSVTIRNNNLDELIGSDDLNEEIYGDSISCIFLKNIELPCFFVTHKGFEKSLVKISARRLVLINSVFGFSSLSCEFLPISRYDSSHVSVDDSLDIERSFSTFLNGHLESLIDQVIPFFLLRTLPDNDCDYFNIWRRTCSEVLVRLMGNKIVRDQHDVRVLTIKADKKIDFVLNDASGIHVDCFQELQDIVSWIVSPKRDAKTRHQIYLGCFVREGVGGVIWDCLKSSATHALEAAQLNYDSLLDKEARESIKVMVDIRKAVFDVAAQVSKDAQEISNRVAGDIVAIVGLLITRLALFEKGKLDPFFAKLLILMAIVYISYRAYSVLHVSRQFFASAEVARESWSRRIFSNLTSVDKAELSDAPINQAKLILSRALDTAGIAYAFLLFILAILLII